MYVHSDGEGTGCTFAMEIPVYQPSSVSSRLNPLRRLNSIVDTLNTTNHSGRTIHNSHRVVTGRQVNIYVEPAAIAAPEIVYFDTSSFSVLVVDDAATNRKMLCRLIRPRFLHVAEASDGLKALNHVRDSMRKPDVILMDFVMPNMDGPTATKEIRALGYRGIIIGVTGNALPADIELFLFHGANKVLVKPLRLEELYAAITGKMR